MKGEGKFGDICIISIPIPNPPIPNPKSIYP